MATEGHRDIEDHRGVKKFVAFEFN